MELELGNGRYFGSKAFALDKYAIDYVRGI